MSDSAEADFRGSHVCVVGLGLMGGSLAMALRDKVVRITAEDTNPAVIEAAREAGVIDAAGELGAADIVVLATPSHVIPAQAAALRVEPGTLVLDLGSTKHAICDALDVLPDGVLAVGGHPMCGLAENGYRNAIPTLYEGARFVLCETAHTTPQAQALAEMLVRAVGATPLWMERAQHDYLVAVTSHLPHLLSFGLMRLAMEVGAGEPALFDLAAGGFDGATRLARTSEAMITGMFSTNPGPIRALLADLHAHLDALEAILDDPAALEGELGQIVAARRAYTDQYEERPIA